MTCPLSIDFSVRFQSAAAVERGVVLFCQGLAQPGDAAATMTAPASVVEYHDRHHCTAAGWRIAGRRIRMALHGLSLQQEL